MTREERDAIGGQMLRERKELRGQQAAIGQKMRQAMVQLKEAASHLEYEKTKAPLESYPSADEVKEMIEERERINARLEQLEQDIENFC